MCKHCAVCHRKTLSITESYQREHLSSLEKLSSKKRLKACVHLDQEDEGWKANMHAFCGSMREEKTCSKPHWQRVGKILHGN